MDGVNTTQMFSQPFAEDIYPANAMKTDGKKIGTTWETSDDPSVTRYGESLDNGIFFLSDNLI